MLEKNSKNSLKKRTESNEALTSLKNQLLGIDFCYKIKLRSDGYRLVYQIKQDDSGVVNVVLSIVVKMFMRACKIRVSVLSLSRDSDPPVKAPPRQDCNRRAVQNRDQNQRRQREDISGKAFGQIM
ncbi:hypothetical protein [Sodalis sp. RH16]|uniref:hypothetical protein n=1 Tax=Sodalis sp. RH16 TaxID=3394331 RepID=UPI0039B63080